MQLTFSPPPPRDQRDPSRVKARSAVDLAGEGVG